MKRLILLMLLASSALAQTPVQGMFPLTIGVDAANWAVGGVNYNTNGANNIACQSFILSNDKYLSKVKINMNTPVGSPSQADTEMELRADNSGFPSGSAIEEKDCDATPAIQVNTFSGFTSALTAGVRYWLCLNNANGTPASNYTVVRPSGSSSAGSLYAPWFTGWQVKWGWAFCHSTDNGATCATSYPGRPIMQLEFSDGTFGGVGLKPETGSEGTNYVYSARELGVTFTVPADGPGYNIRRVSMPGITQGTVPSGGIRYRIYTGTGSSRTLVATSDIIPQANYATGWNPADLTSSYTAAAGTTLSVMLGAASGGDSSNYVKLELGTVENTAGSKSLQLFGNLKATYLNSTFADDDTKIYPFMLGLDTNDPYDMPASGGGIINQNSVSGGAQ